MAVRAEWPSPADCIAFWSTNYQDDSATKLTLMETMATWCFRCNPVKGRRELFFVLFDITKKLKSFPVNYCKDNVADLMRLRIEPFV
jgi:hypothetical protein